LLSEVSLVYKHPGECALGIIIRQIGSLPAGPFLKEAIVVMQGGPVTDRALPVASAP